MSAKDRTKTWVYGRLMILASPHTKSLITQRTGVWPIQLHLSYTFRWCCTCHFFKIIDSPFRFQRAIYYFCSHVLNFAFFILCCIKFVLRSSSWYLQEHSRREVPGRRKRDGLRRRKMIQINKRRTLSVSIFRALFFRHDHDVFPASPGAVT